MPEHRPRSVLVTGGAGFIGSNFVRYLLTRDDAVHIVNLDKLTYAGSRENLAGLPDESRHEFVLGDICDRELVDRMFLEHRIDTVVHFAAESHVDRSISSPVSFIDTNVTGTFVLLEAARKAWLTDGAEIAAGCRFHHASTDEVYGSLGPNDPRFTESTAYAPNSPYAATKAGSDHLVRAWFHTFGLPVTTSNCSNNFGPYQHPEKLIPTIIRNCMAGRSIPLYGDGTNIRDWLYVEDHCHALDRVIRKGTPGEVYNIGGGNERSNLDIVHSVCSVMDELLGPGRPCNELITFVEDRPGHDWRYAIEGEKITGELNWEPSTDFKEALQETCRWYLTSNIVHPRWARMTVSG